MLILTVKPYQTQRGRNNNYPTQTDRRQGEGRENFSNHRGDLYSEQLEGGQRGSPHRERGTPTTTTTSQEKLLELRGTLGSKTGESLEGIQGLQRKHWGQGGGDREPVQGERGLQIKVHK